MARTLYLFKSGVLKRSNNTLKFVSKDETVIYPVYQINAIYVFGEIEVNKRLLGFLNSHGIVVTFFNYYGNCIGSFLPIYHRFGKVLIKQVECLQNVKCRNDLIFEFLMTQFHNQLSVLKYYRKKGENLDFFISEMECQRDKFLNLKKNEEYWNKAILCEARIKQLYFRGLDTILASTEFIFDSRSTYPPSNEVNAMLSFGYALLYSDFMAAIYQTSLCPEISFIHSPSKSVDSLKYDLADMVKAVYVDRLVLRLIRKGHIGKEHFSYGEGCYLNEEGKKVFICEYEAFLEKTIKDSKTDHYYSYRQLLAHECHKLIGYICDEKEYQGYRMGW